MAYAREASAAASVAIVEKPKARVPSATPAKPARDALALVPSLKLDRGRDGLLTDFGKATMEDRYLLKGESYQDMFARVATAYSDDVDHAQRIYDYISKLWFMPA